jgi:hypothetical protein
MNIWKIRNQINIIIKDYSIALGYIDLFNNDIVLYSWSFSGLSKQQLNKNLYIVDHNFQINHQSPFLCTWKISWDPPTTTKIDCIQITSKKYNVKTTSKIDNGGVSVYAGETITLSDITVDFGLV